MWSSLNSGPSRQGGRRPPLLSGWRDVASRGPSLAQWPARRARCKRPRGEARTQTARRPTGQARASAHQVPCSQSRSRSETNDTGCPAGQDLVLAAYCSEHKPLLSRSRAKVSFRYYVRLAEYSAKVVGRPPSAYSGSGARPGPRRQAGLPQLPANPGATAAPRGSVTMTDTEMRGTGRAMMVETAHRLIEQASCAARAHNAHTT